MKIVDDKNYKKITILTLLGVVILITLMLSFKTINSGEVGLKIRFGKIVESSKLEEGLNFKIPYIEKIVKVNIKVQKYENEVELSSSSKDLQVINNIVINVNYQIDGKQAPKLYKNIGKNYEEIVITPAIQESVKSIISKYTAEELVTKRSEVANCINDNLNEKLNGYGINVLSTAIKNFDFSDEYNKAIEKKAVAEQEVLTAKQELEKSKVLAEKELIEAEATKKTNELIKQSLTDELIAKQFIEKWDGKLPTTYAGEDIMSIFNLK